MGQVCAQPAGAVTTMARAQRCGCRIVLIGPPPKQTCVGGTRSLCLDRAHLSPDRDYDTCLTNRQACNSACPLTHHSRIPSSPAGSSCERATWLALSAMRRNTSAGARRATIPPALSAHFHSDIREPATACDLWRWCRCGCAYTAMAGC